VVTEQQILTPSAGSDQYVSGHAVPLDLIARYDRPGPRYTSYPTAPEWQDISRASVVEALHRVAEDTRPLSVYVHLPFCDRMCLFCGCNVVVARAPEKFSRYVKALQKEIRLTADLVGEKRLTQLHLGGGTPTTFAPEQLQVISETILEKFAPNAEAEMGVEIDPMVTTPTHLKTLREVGFNRLSMGVQDFGDDVQELTERRQPDQKTSSTFAEAREAGFASINLDLMYGLPGQTPEHLAHSARRAIELGADRVAVFGYAHVPWLKPHQKKMEQFGVPAAPARWAMFNAARVTLLDAGYQAIGMDHFAKPTDELALAWRKRRLNRNFQGYTVLEPTNLLGFGLTAISDVEGAYVQNKKRLSDYYRSVEANELGFHKGIVLTAEDHLRRAVITAIMCNLTVEFRDIEQRFSINFREHFSHELASVEPLVADGLVVFHPQALEVTERGRVFVRNVAMAFDEYLHKKVGDQPRFSRTV
jgi:oxygen-independent coproporphyrinogen-3 oxidase